MIQKILCLSFALVALASAAPEPRVVGGTPLQIEDFPYVAAILYHYQPVTVQRCIGTVISSFHVLTTAFCFTGANTTNMSIRAGSTNSMSGGVLVGISTVIKHPDYLETPRTADIAVIVIDGTFYMTNAIQNIFLPPQGQYLAAGSKTKIVSWGFETEDSSSQILNLKTISLTTIPLEVCQQSYSEADGVVIDDRVICGDGTVEDAGICSGDSGAPMAMDRLLIGLSTYHIGCGYDEYPDVFTRIDRYTDWIMASTAGQARIGFYDYI